MHRCFAVLAVAALAACGPDYDSQYVAARRDISANIESGKLAGEQLAMAYLQRGYTLQLDKQYERALADYDRAVATAPRMPVAYSTRALLLFGLGRFDQALADASEVIALSPPTDPSGHLLRGEILLERRDYTDALAAYDEVLARDPNNWRGYSARGTVLTELGEDERALADLERAIELDPGSLGTTKQRNCIRYQGQTTPQCTTREIEIPSSIVMSRAYRSRGMIRFKRGDYAGAAADLDRGGWEGDTQVYAALAYYALGECRKAHYAFNRYENANDADRDPMIAAHHDFIAKTPCGEDVL